MQTLETTERSQVPDYVLLTTIPVWETWIEISERAFCLLLQAVWLMQWMGALTHVFSPCLSNTLSKSLKMFEGSARVPKIHF